METTYAKPLSFTKLNRKQVIDAIINGGATLKKTYAVYSYFALYFPDGSVIYNLRKDATNNLKEVAELDFVNLGKDGFFYRKK